MASHRPRRAGSISGARSWLPSLVAALVMTAAALTSSPAAGYVRYVSSKGKPYAWQEGCVWMLVFPHGLTEMTPEQVFAAEHAAQGAWSHGAQGCTYMQIIDTDVPGEVVPPVPSYDLTNTTVFHTDQWCREGAASNGSDCYDPSALAITSVWTTSDGRIYDADIEVNAVNFRWTDIADPGSAPAGFQDLQNTLTHETGHLLGLDHTCFIPDAAGKTKPGIDNLGNAVPYCSSLSADSPIRATTMFPSAVPGDTSKRVLSPDDIQAVCDIYPVASGAGHACQPPQTTDAPPAKGGCALAPSDPAGGKAPVVVALALAGLLVRRRRAHL